MLQIREMKSEKHCFDFCSTLSVKHLKSKYLPCLQVIQSKHQCILTQADVWPWALGLPLFSLYFPGTSRIKDLSPAKGFRRPYSSRTAVSTTLPLIEMIFRKCVKVYNQFPYISAGLSKFQIRRGVTF